MEALFPSSRSSFDLYLRLWLRVRPVFELFLLSYPQSSEPSSKSRLYFEHFEPYLCPRAFSGPLAASESSPRLFLDCEWVERQEAFVKAIEEGKSAIIGLGELLSKRGTYEGQKRAGVDGFLARRAV